MTLTAASVVAMVCAECEADLRGGPKVQRGDVFVCPSCAIRLERPDARPPHPARHGATHG